MTIPKPELSFLFKTELLEEKFPPLLAYHAHLYPQAAELKLMHVLWTALHNPRLDWRGQLFPVLLNVG